MIKERFIREKEAREISGLSRSTRWRKENNGTFPSRYVLSGNATAYKLSEIEAWINEQSKLDMARASKAGAK